MALGTYGTRIPANVTSNDVEIFFSYSKTRAIDDTTNTTFTKIDSSLLTQCGKQDGTVYYDTESTMLDNVLEGMYNLKLPIQYFNQKGFYTVYIKPKEIPAIILDVSTLSSYPDVRGLVIDTTTITDASLKEKLRYNNSLVGYRIIYFDDNMKRQNVCRLITSNNRCEPIVEQMSSSTDKTISYRYNESGSLVFLTVTPSAANSYNPNAQPFIGTAAQKVLLVDTSFEPICLDIEMTDHDADTISTMLEGSQLRDLDNGLITTFNSNDEIYHQKQVYSLKESTTGEPVYEVLKNSKNNIDFTQTITDK